MSHDLDATPTATNAERDTIVRAIRRPVPALMKYYCLVSLLSGPLLPVVLLPLYFRYYTLRYTFGNDGISVSWGLLFRREHHLTYPRIQDIHVTRNILERWLGIGTVSVQTASGSGGAEAEIVGVTEFEAIRDFLYARMRGLHKDGPDDDDGPSDADPVALLTEIRDALVAIRAHLDGREVGA